MGTIKFLTGLAFVALFAIAIISYSVGFAADNQAAITLNDDENFNSLSSNVKSGLSDFETSAETSNSILVESNIKSGDDNVEGGGQFKTGPADVLGTTKNVLSAANKAIFGDDPNFGVLLTTFSAFLVLISGLYIWKTWKGGNPD